MAAGKQAETAEFYLVVHNAFEDYRRGDVIKDAQKIQEILNTHYANFVHKVSATSF